MSEPRVTREDLKKLPPRALAAFATRCAMRVLPLYRLSKGVPDRVRHYQAVDSAVRLAAEYAAGGSRTAESGAAYAARAAADGNAADHTAAAADYAAAARVAAHAADAITAHDAAAAAAYAAAAHAAAAYAAAAHADAAAADAARRDYQLLASASGDPVDPDEKGPLGPLWPEGAPEWYAEGLKQFRTVLAGDTDASELETALLREVGDPSLMIVWDPELLSAKDYADLVAQIGDVVREQGGSGIKRIRSRGFGVPVGEEALL